MYEDNINLVEGVLDSVDPSLSFDILLGFVTRSNYVSDDSIVDLSIYKYSFVSCDDVSLLSHYSLTSQILDIEDAIAQHDSDERLPLQ